MTVHFYASLTEATSQVTSKLVIEAPTPEIALKTVLDDLPESWEGGIEIDDHETLTPEGMPLLDYWKEPS